jgi:hypothetical protein
MEQGHSFSPCPLSPEDQNGRRPAGPQEVCQNIVLMATGMKMDRTWIRPENGDNE